MVEDDPRDDSADTKPVGERLYVAMQAASMNKARLAEEVGVTDQAVGQWIVSGQIASHRIPKICQVLRISSDWLLEGYGPMRRMSSKHYALIELYEQMSEQHQDTWETTGNTFAQSQTPLKKTS